MRNLLIAGVVVAAALLWALSGRDRAGPAPSMPRDHSTAPDENLGEVDGPLQAQRDRDGLPALTRTEVDSDPRIARSGDVPTRAPAEDSCLGITVERDGAPAPGVGVWICDNRAWQPLGYRDMPGFRGAFEAVPEAAVFRATDGSGAVRFADIRRARYSIGLGTAAGHDRPTHFVSAELHAGHTYTVVIGTATVRGSVHGPDGRPRAGAQIAVASRRPDPAHHLSIAAVTTTDARGRYAIGDLAQAEYVVTMAPDGLSRGMDGSARRRVTLAVGETVELNFGSHLGAPRWRGRVLNSFGEAFLGTGRLDLTRVDGDGAATTEIRVGGHFEFAFSPGTWSVAAQVTGAPSGGFDLGQVELLPEDTLRDLTVPGTRVAGVLSPPDVIEGPVERHSWTCINFRLDGHDYPAAIRTVNVDEAGHFSIDGLGPGTWRVDIWPGKLRSNGPVEVTVHAGDRTQELNLGR